ncbi:MAG TPA: GAF domain-containing protein [Ktedonobacterales bacterium]
MEQSEGGPPAHDAALVKGDPAAETLAALVAPEGAPSAGVDARAHRPAAALRAERADPATDPPGAALARLTELIGAFDAATAALHEADTPDGVLEAAGAALQARGIASLIVLFDAPLPAGSPGALSAGPRLAYTSIAPRRWPLFERTLGRSIQQVALAWDQVEVVASLRATHETRYLPGPALHAALRQAIPWLTVPVRRRLLRLAGASSATAAPLVSRGQVLGIIGLWARDLRPEDTAVLGAFARQIAIALDAARGGGATAARLEAQVRRAETLARVALALETERDLPALLARIGLAARELTGADGAGFLLRDTPSAPFAVVGAVGVSRETVHALQQPYVPHLDSLRPLLGAGHPVLLADAPTVASPREAQLLARARVRAFAAVPLLASAGWVSGALLVGHGVAGAFTQEHADLLAALAAQASAAIERTRALEEAQRRADELEAMFASVTAGVAIYDPRGQMVRINQAGERITRHAIVQGEPPADRARRFEMRELDGTPVPLERMPSVRAVHGESFHGVEYLVNGEDGPDTRISVSGAPLRGADGVARGSVLEYRNVTEMRRLERRTRVALDALLRIAAALVTPEETAAALREERANSSSRHARDGGGVPASASRLDTILGYLAQLAREMLGARRALLSLIDPETRIEMPGGAAGLSAREMRQWLAEFAPGDDNPRFGDINPPAAARLREGETVEIDFRQPPYDGQSVPFDIALALVVPLRVEGELVGMLMLDQRARDAGAPEHHFSADEVALAQGVARLAALAVQRERLEHVAAEVEGLRVANALKEEFLSIASHELKTPLTVLRARTQAAERRLIRLGQTEAAAQFAPVRASLDRIGALVRELLDASRIEAGEPHLHPQPVHLGQLAAALVGEAQEASSRAITLQGAAAPDLWITGDPDRLPQVVTNLLDNALKYGDSEEPIIVRVWRAPAAAPGSAERSTSRAGSPEGGEVLLTVSDRGVGIPADELSRVFERFYRARTSSSRQYGGLGLGLHIAANIVEWHHGRIWAESRGPGGGSTFGVAFPACAAPVAPDATPGVE